MHPTTTSEEFTEGRPDEFQRRPCRQTLPPAVVTSPDLETIRGAIIGILTEVEDPQVLLLADPLGMAIGEIHASARGPVIVFLVGPVVVCAPEIVLRRVVRIEHQEDIGGTRSRSESLGISGDNLGIDGGLGLLDGDGRTIRQALAHRAEDLVTRAECLLVYRVVGEVQYVGRI